MVDRGQAGENGLRYELWESMTGGESWNIKQVDAKPIPFPGARRDDEAASDPRRCCLEDISHREAGWRSMAVRWLSFAVSLGQCKPEPPEVEGRTPPPETEPEPPAPARTKATAPPSLKGKKKR